MCDHNLERGGGGLRPHRGVDGSGVETPRPLPLHWRWCNLRDLREHRRGRSEAALRIASPAPLRHSPVTPLVLGSAIGSDAVSPLLLDPLHQGHDGGLGSLLGLFTLSDCQATGLSVLNDTARMGKLFSRDIAFGLRGQTGYYVMCKNLLYM